MRNGLLVVILAVCGLATVAQASTITLSYTGAAYNLYNDSKTTEGAYSCTPGSTPCSLEISLTLYAPLGDNLNNGDAFRKSFSFTDGVNTITDTPDITDLEFLFSTDGSGNITGWDVYVETSDAEMLTVNTPNYKVDTDSYNGADYYVYSSGSWSESQTPSPTPEPASLALMSAGVLAMFGLAWRERRARQLPSA